MPDTSAWLGRLAEVCPRLDPTIARIFAGLLARTDLPQDCLLIVADALEEGARECITAGRPLDGLPYRLLRNLLIREAETRKGSFW